MAREVVLRKHMQGHRPCAGWESRHEEDAELLVTQEGFSEEMKTR